MLPDSVYAYGVSCVNSPELYPDLHRAGEAGLPLLVVNNVHAKAVIALQGAQVLSFLVHEKPELLWMSPLCKLEKGKAIRAGIPLCLPWFGPADGGMQHGFARVSDWTLVSTEILADGATRLLLELAGEVSPQKVWPHAFCFRLEINVGQKLTLELSVENRSDLPAPLSCLFHTYFAVPDVAHVRVTGLEGKGFIDKLDSGRKTQNGAVTIQSAMDRIYLDVPTEQILEATDRKVIIESNAAACVVWNAWDQDRNIADMGEGSHAGYLCVERGDVADHGVILPPGATHQIWMKLSGQYAL